MRVVVDSNIFINGIYSQGQDFFSRACKRIVAASLDGRIKVVANNDVLFEYEWMLIDRILPVRRDVRVVKNIYLPAVAGIVKYIEVIPPHITVDPAWIDDPDDMMFVETALDGGVKAIVSDDGALKNFVRRNQKKNNRAALGMIKQHDITFYSPEEFVKVFSSLV